MAKSGGEGDFKAKIHFVCSMVRSDVLYVLSVNRQERKVSLFIQNPGIKPRGSVSPSADLIS
jgi:hypothetical protein